GDAQLFWVSCIYKHSFHGKWVFLSLDFDRKPKGVASAKQDVRAAGPVVSRAGRHTDESRPWGVGSCGSEATAGIPPA
ncbi:MAG: hypothetical protein ACTHV7_14070, partial [Oleiphilaceae bacterium]